MSRNLTFPVSEIRDMAVGFDSETGEILITIMVDEGIIHPFRTGQFKAVERWGRRLGSVGAIGEAASNNRRAA